jgi:predicted small metal-binding protein
MADDKSLGPGQPDYGHNNPTGGTKQNEGKINPQGPTSGTENYNRDRKDHQQSTAHRQTDSDPGAGPIPTNSGDIDETGDLDPGASATPDAGVGDTRGQHSFRCADAGFADCRWEASMASSDQLWNEIQRHADNVHGMKFLDERTRGKIQDVIRVRRAA